MIPKVMLVRKGITVVRVGVLLFGLCVQGNGECGSAIMLCRLFFFSLSSSVFRDMGLIPT